jgi:ATP-binding cassette subfamily F protein 2
MESIDSLATAIKNFTGGLVLVSHDMRLISQVADTIWICDNGCVTKFPGDIAAFKKHMRAKLEIGAEALKGDASKKAKDDKDVTKKEKKKAEKQPELVPAVNKNAGADASWGKTPAPAGVAPPTSAPLSTVGDLKKDLPAAAPAAAAAVCPPAPPPAADGACPNQGKMEWRKCDLCGKRHP